MKLSRKAVAALRRLHSAKAVDLRTLARLARLDPETDFQNRDFRGVDFGNSDLSGFNFAGARIEGANLSNVHGFDIKLFFGCSSNIETRWPLSPKSKSIASILQRSAKTNVQEEMLPKGFSNDEVRRRILENKRLPSSWVPFIHSLDLSFTNIKKLTSISKLFSLSSLDLAGTEIDNLTPLSKLSNLRFLNIWGTNVTDLSSIAGLLSLEILYISGLPEGIESVLSRKNSISIFR